MSRIGKIARLPHDIREQLNRRLLDGPFNSACNEADRNVLAAGHAMQGQDELDSTQPWHDVVDQRDIEHDLGSFRQGFDRVGKAMGDAILDPADDTLKQQAVGYVVIDDQDLHVRPDD